MTVSGPLFAEAAPRASVEDSSRLPDLLRAYVTHLSISEWWEAFQMGQGLVASEVGDLIAMLQMELAFRCGEFDILFALRDRCAALLPPDKQISELLRRAEDVRRRRGQLSLPETVIGVASPELRHAAQAALDCHYWRLARDYLEHLAETDAADAWTFSRLARAWAALGGHVQAIAALRRLAELDPSQADPDQEARLHKFEARRKQSYAAHLTRLERHPALSQLVTSLADPAFAGSPAGLALAAQCRRLNALTGADLLPADAAMPSPPTPEDTVTRTSWRPGGARALRMPNAWLHAKRTTDLLAEHTVDEVDRLSIRTVQGAGWVRVLFTLFEGLPRSVSTRVTVRCPEPMEVTAAPTVGIVVYDDNREYKVLHRFPRPPLHAWRGPSVEFKLPSRLLAELAETNGANHYYVCIEVAQAATIHLSNLEVEEVRLSEELTPYRDTTLPICGLLLDHNQSLSSVGQRSPRAWLQQQARLAVRLECFETAAASLRLADQLGVAEEPAKRLEFLQLYAEVAIAEGRVEELRARLLRDMAITRTDDTLWTAFSLTFPAEERYLPTLGKLPSGKPNRYFLSRVDASGELLDLLVRDAAEPVAEPEDVLLLASQFRRVHPPLYRDHWNRYLRHFDLTPIEAVDLALPNVLEGLRLAPAPDSLDGDATISVLMSAFNAEATLDYAIRSVLAQSHRKVELLVCDDASTDRTLARMMAWRGHPAVRLFRSRANQGPYNIRTALIEQATGRFLTFQDADDVAHPQRLERQLGLLARPGIQAVVGSWVRIRPGGDVVFFRDQLCLRMCVVSLLAETAFFRGSRGYRQVLCGGDTEILERLKVWHGQDAVAQLRQPLIFGLWSERSLTRQGGLEATEDGYRAPPRRLYAEAAARSRLLGTSIVPDAEVDRVIGAAGIHRAHAGVEAL